jgi:nitrogen-specific signal transduction histidine kinase
MGLGLCLVKAFVRLHGGTVEFASEPGAGTTFAFTLPRHHAPAAASPVAPEATAVTPTAGEVRA